MPLYHEEKRYEGRPTKEERMGYQRQREEIDYRYQPPKEERDNRYRLPQQERGYGYAKERVENNDQAFPDMKGLLKLKRVKKLLMKLEIN